MIEIKPRLQYEENCPQCKAPLTPSSLLWQGMHVCVESKCSACGVEIIEELRIGHAFMGSCQFILKTASIFGDDNAKGWGKELLKSLQNPNSQTVEVMKEAFYPCKRVILLNCIDFLYGHSLLKLLNAQRHLAQQQDYGLIVLVPKFLRWMVPQGVAEIWTIDIPLKRGRDYYPSLNQYIQKELERFTEVQLSEAYSHPSQFDITRFTGVPIHDFAQQQFNITFIWREDRLWCNQWLFKLLRKLQLLDLALILQNWKIHRLMHQLRAKIPQANYVVAGLGKKTRFSAWIEDLRTNVFDENSERQLCKVYSDSRLVIGIHGSNMLLPSGHAGMTIDLMPDDRLGNFAQDILYHEVNPRFATYRYRFLPIQIKIQRLARIATIMITGLESFLKFMTSDKTE